MTLLQYIKLYPEAFSRTAEMRSITTPSATNRSNHILLSEAIDSQDWDTVERVINLPEYQSPLDGVIACLIGYSHLDMETCTEIYEFWKGY